MPASSAAGIYIHKCIYIYIHTYVYMYIYTHTYFCIHAHIYIYMYVGVYVYIHLYLSIYLYLYLHPCIYRQIYLHVCTDAGCICAYSHVFQRTNASQMLLGHPSMGAFCHFLRSCCEVTKKVACAMPRLRMYAVEAFSKATSKLRLQPTWRLMGLCS